ncbi:hypothetical protein BDR26DRAFT_1014324 [Obelidium mucronatum]|nr:hypothetical protein BDR26DRAFT_1014324 [Obelidium mucronatum]
MPNTLACGRCRSGKRKCDKNEPSCGRCAQSGFACEYPIQPSLANDQANSTPSKLTACSRCRVHKRKCIPGPEACERCTRIGVVDQCDFPGTSQQAVPVTQPSLYLTPAPRSNEYIIAANDASLMEYGERECELEDLDLLPTIEDWTLAFSHAQTLNIRFSYDGDNFLKSFFQQPPVFRLIVCALAAFYTNQQEHVQLGYYRRGRKAVMKAIHQSPTHQTVQSLLLLSIFAETKGQPDLSHSLFQMAINLVTTLRLDIDPDNSPWLMPLNLTERQKEDRRRAFWGCYVHLAHTECVSNTFKETTLSAANIKAPGTIYDPHMIFQGNTIVKPESELFRLIGIMRRHFESVPTGLNDILENPATVQKSTQLDSILSNIPLIYYFLPDSPHVFTPTDYTRFINQLAQLPLSEVPTCISMNFAARSAISVLHRPQMYLSACPSCHPLLLPPNHQETIKTAITKCHSTALQTINIYSFYRAITVGAYKDQIPEDRKNYYGFTEDIAVYMFFEAVLCLWFLICRMNSGWWDFVGCEKMVLDGVLKENVLAMVDLVRSVAEEAGSAGGGSFDPLVVCLDAMLKEMEGYDGDHCGEKNSNVDGTACVVGTVGNGGRRTCSMDGAS